MLTVLAYMDFILKIIKQTTSKKCLFNDTIILTFLIINKHEKCVSSIASFVKIKYASKKEFGETML